MFYITINTERRRCQVEIYCSNGGTEVRFTADHVKAIKNFNLETDTRLTVDNGHSVHNLYWDEKHITFDGMPKEPDWEEPLYVVVRNNPAIMKSLKKCLKIWKKKAEELDQA